MAVSKLVIYNLDEQKTIVTLYNPKQYTLSRAVNWMQVDSLKRDISSQSFSGGRPRTLAMELTIDTVNTFTGTTFKTSVEDRKTDKSENVMNYVKEIEDLTYMVRARKRPPLLLVVWGVDSLKLYCVLKSVNQTYNMFARDGTPIRASLQLEFEELDPAIYQIVNDDGSTGRDTETGSKVIITSKGDDCFSVSLKAYGSATHYKEVAKANKIYDISKKFQKGLVLNCPKLIFS